MAKKQSHEDNVINEAREILYNRMRKEHDEPLTTPASVFEYLEMRYVSQEHESFVCVMLDNRNNVIACREMFRGTINGASVYPREIVKQVLTDNASQVILAHNHPSGNTDPSQADIAITKRLKDALALVDVRILDHIIVGEIGNSISFAERGLI